MLAWGALIMWLALSGCEDAMRSADAASEPHAPADLLTSKTARARGRALFEQRCALCHGERADGEGVRRQGLSSPPPSFRSQRFRDGHDPRQVFLVIRHGKRGTSMPAWPTFDERETWDLVAFVLRASEPEP